MGPLTEFANSEKGYNTLTAILKNAGIPCRNIEESGADIFFLRNEKLQFPDNAERRFENATNGMSELELWVWSPRPLDDLLIEPNMPKLDLLISARESKLKINGKFMDKFNKTNHECEYMELPLQQGWNRLSLYISEKDKNDFRASFNCNNKKDFLSLLKVGYNNPEIH